MSETYQLWENGAPFYIGGETPRITPYIIPSDKPLGCIIVLPGGGYCGRAQHEAEPIAKMINDGGYNAFVCDYRVAPNKHPVPLCDCNRAVRFVRHNAAKFNCDPSKIGILGFSAGGHLAVSGCEFYDTVIGPDGYVPDEIDSESARPDAGVFCYGVISLTTHTHDGTYLNLTDGDTGLAYKLSGEVAARADMPPVFMWHTLNDGAVPVENSLDLAAKLHTLGVSCELHVFPDGPHGLGLAPGNPVVSEWSPLLINWLKYTLKW